nr:MAG TPA: hypothetical protein [Caudoviricetes sp.]
MSERLYGREITREALLSPDDLKKVNIEHDETGRDLIISLSEVNKSLEEAVNCFNTLVSIKDKTHSSEAFSDSEKAMISSMMRTFYQRCPDVIRSQEGFVDNFDDRSFSRSADKVLLIITNVLDVFLSILRKFFLWIKSEFTDTGRYVDRLRGNIARMSSKDIHGCEVAFTGKESVYFTIKDSSGQETFDPLDVIARYRNLLELYISDNHVTENIASAMSMTTKVRAYVDLYITPVFPIVSTKHNPSTDLYEYIGPDLPNGYRLKAVMPDTGHFNPSTDKSINKLSLSDAMIMETSKPNMGDTTLTLSDIQLEQLFTDLKSYSRFGSQVVNYTDRIYTALDKLRMSLRKFKLSESNATETSDLKYLSFNMAAISYITRTIKQPFFDLSKMASYSERMLLTKLIHATKS